MAKLKGLDLGLADDRFVLVDAPDYQDRLDAHRVEPAIADGIDEDDLFLLLFTSGTTGMSKGVKCSQGRLRGSRTRTPRSTGTTATTSTTAACRCSTATR